MGNSIAKNVRVSVGLPSVTVVNHHKDKSLWVIIQGYEQYFDHFEINFILRTHTTK